MAEAQSPHLDQLEIEAKREVGKRIYTKSGDIIDAGLQSVGIQVGNINSATDYSIKLKSVFASANGQEVTTGRNWPAGRRPVTVRYNGEDGPVELGSFFDAEGHAFQAADSSQGLPWYDSNLSLDQLHIMAGVLETITEETHTTTVTLERPYTHPNPAN